jgi:hypothetical protein
MNWIKRNYDQAILAFVALVLLGVAGWIIYCAVEFPSMFSGIEAQVYHNSNVPPVDLSAISNTVTAIDKPATWDLTDTEGSMFVSTPYLVKDGTLYNPITSTVPLRPPVPNRWIIENKLDILDPNVLNEDPSGDGFTNLDKWMGTKGDGSDAYDPNQKDSHPPYWTKLRLKQYIKQPFRLLFQGYDGTPDKMAAMDFEINPMDVAGGGTQFLHMGDIIAGTKFKLTNFESKSVLDPSTDSHTDVSELTVQNTETGDNVVLVLNQVANSPDSYADFVYQWNNTEFQVKKGKEFALPPETTKIYILIDITDDNAVIQTPTGQKETIQKLQQ